MAERDRVCVRGSVWLRRKTPPPWLHPRLFPLFGGAQIMNAKRAPLGCGGGLAMADRQPALLCAYMYMCFLSLSPALARAKNKKRRTAARGINTKKSSACWREDSIIKPKCTLVCARKYVCARTRLACLVSEGENKKIFSSAVCGRGRELIIIMGPS